MFVVVVWWRLERDVLSIVAGSVIVLRFVHIVDDELPYGQGCCLWRRHSVM